MNKTILTILIFIFTYSANLKAQENFIINKDNGNIILAYKGFEKFLHTEQKWSDYEEHILNAFPSLMSIHQRYIQDDLVDPVIFKKEVSDYKLNDFTPYFNQISDKQVTDLYNSVIKKMDSVLIPLGKVDVCLFLPYFKDCFVQDVSGTQTVFISIKYDIETMYLILIHEYAHCLHFQRRPDEDSNLQSWIVGEGIASIFPVLLSDNSSIYEGLWMMPKDNIDWCIQNEQQIIDRIHADLVKDSDEVGKRYIAGGEGFANPPSGFPEKTGYYLGYKIIEKCLAKGMSLSELCKMDSKQIIDNSDIFKN